MRTIHYLKFIKFDELPEEFGSKIRNIIDNDDVVNIITNSDNDGDYMIMSLTEDKILEFIKLTKDFDILSSHRDVTYDITMGNFINDNIQSFMKSKQLKNMIYNILTMDMVLDKISIKGMNSLTDVDKAILNNASIERNAA